MADKKPQNAPTPGRRISTKRGSCDPPKRRADLPTEAIAEPPSQLSREALERRQSSMSTKRRRPGPELGYEPQATSESAPHIPDVPPTEAEE